MRSWLSWLIISAVIIIADQETKHWIVQSFSAGESLPVTGFFNLVLAFNEGAAFSFLSQASGWQKPFFVCIALLASVVILFLLHKHRTETLFSFALSLILGGALGNVWDRITLGHVVDFLDFYYSTYHWPAFNVADSAITVGAALLIWDSLRQANVKK